MEPVQPPPQYHGTPLLRVLALLFFALLIAVLSSLGTYWYINRQLAKQTPETTQPVYQPTPTEFPVTSVSPTPDETINKLVAIYIKELGITIRVSESIKDLTYSISSVKHPEFVATTASFSTQSLTNKDVNCSSNGAAPPLGGLARVEGQYPSNPNQANTAGTLVKQFPKFYIGFTSPQATCTDNANTQGLAFSQMKTFKESFSTIK